MNTINPSNRILALALAVCLLLGMTLYLPGPVTAAAAGVELATAAGLAPDPTGSRAVPGNQVYFGEYNGEPILWRVLENSNGEALLFSENILTGMVFRADANVWKDSSIREYMNTALLAKLPPAVQDAIVVKDVETSGVHTQDRLYLLSVEEVEAAFPSEDDRCVIPSREWWLRSLGTSGGSTIVYYSGFVDRVTTWSSALRSLRPAFDLDVSKAIFDGTGTGAANDPWVVGGQTARALAVNDYVRFPVDGIGDTDWQVIDVGGGVATLLCTNVIGDPRPFSDNTTHWAASTVRAFLNPETDGDYAAGTFFFTDGESRAILEQTITEAGTTTKDRLFLLSKGEVENPAYFSGADARKASYTCWLRSPYSTGSVDAIYSNGSIAMANPTHSDYNYGIRPAFRLDLSTVLFTSARGGKPAPGGAALAAVEPLSADPVKLTMLDPSLDLTVIGAAIDAKSGTQVDIAYTGAATGPGRSVSVVVADQSTGEWLYYGRPVDCTGGNGSGSASFQLPAELAPGTYKLLVFGEEANGDNRTDYAGAPQVLTLNVAPPDNTPPNVFDVFPRGGGVSLGTSSLSVTFDKAMNTAVPITGTVTINNGATLTDATWRDDRTITYALGNLAYATTYTVSIAGFQDLEGNVMDAVTDNRHQFITEAAIVTPTNLKVGSMENNTAAVGEDYTKTIPVDYNGSLPLGYSADGLPDGVSINEKTISGKPAAAGIYPITVTVSEQGGSLADSGSYTLTVTAAPATPARLTLATPADLTVTEGEAFTKTFSVTYTGNGSLAYTINGLPDGVTYSTTTGEITGPATQSGTFPVSIAVTDGTLRDTGSFTLTVAPSGGGPGPDPGPDPGPGPGPDPGPDPGPGPNPNTYTVTVQADGNGTADASPNPAEEGEIVTLTARPATGYRFKEWRVISGGAVLDNLNSSPATFAMPGNAVTVRAVFESGGDMPDPVPDRSGSSGGSATGGGTRSGRSGSSSGGRTNTAPAKMQIPASAFSWDGGRTLTIEHDSVTVLGLTKVLWDGLET